MSAKGSASDLTQILLLTLFLCSGVFGVWGFWVKKKQGTRIAPVKKTVRHGYTGGVKKRTKSRRHRVLKFGCLPL